jgi:hypothetical protein
MVDSQRKNVPVPVPGPPPEGACKNGCPRDVRFYTTPQKYEHCANGTGTLLAVAHVLDTLVCTTGGKLDPS